MNPMFLETFYFLLLDGIFLSKLMRMTYFEFQNPDHNDTWKFIIAFCMTQPEGTSPKDLKRMLAEQFGIVASETACALAAIRF